MVAFGMEVNPSVDASSMTYYGAYTELMVPSTCSQPVGAVQGTGVGLDYWGTGACDSIFGGFTYVTLWSDINCADIEAANFPTFHEGTGTIGQAIGSAAGIYNQGGGTITNGWAFQGIQQLTGTTAPNSTTTNGNCFTATIAMHGPCTLVNGHGLHVQSPELNLFHEAGTPTLSHCVGVYIEDQTVTGNGGVNSDPWGIYEANATEKNLLGILMLGGTDAGISRLGAASLAIGNGTQGDASGTLSLAGITSSGPMVFTSAVGSGSAVDALTVQLSEAAASTWDWNFQDGGVQPGTGKHDWTSQIGYNVYNNMAKKATEAAFYLGIESNYEQTQGDSTSSQIEWYLTSISPNAAGGGPAGGAITRRVIRGFQNKLTGNTNVTISATSIDFNCGSGATDNNQILMTDGQMAFNTTMYFVANNAHGITQQNAASTTALPLIWLDSSDHINVGSGVQVNLGSSSTFVAANGDTTLAGNLLVNGGTISGPVSASGLVTVDGNVTGTAAGITLSKPTLIAHSFTPGPNSSITNASTAINTTGATLLVAIVYCLYPGSGITLTDGVNTWHALTVYEATPGAYETKLFYCYAPTTSATHQVTAGNQYGYLSIDFQAWSGTGITSAVYESSTGSSSGGVTVTSIQPGSVVPVTSGDLIISTCMTEGGDPGVPNDSFISTYHGVVVGPYFGVSANYLIAPNTSSVDPTYTFTSAGASATIVVFAAVVPIPTFTGNIVSSSVALTSAADLSWNADSGISRTAAGTLAIGNGTALNASGQLGVAVVRNTGFTVANLPATAGAGKVEGATAYATNGLKPTELTGYGTGVPVFYSAAGPAGAGWYSYPGLALVAS
jgi:hypothetical protein